MGSLVPGWDSHVFDHNITEDEKNKSMTKEEIEAYRKANRKAEDKHIGAISHTQMESYDKESEEIIQKSKLEESSETSLEKFMKEYGWWALTNSAFLNDPPVIREEGPTHNYVSQFYVADKSRTKP